MNSIYKVSIFVTVLVLIMLSFVLFTDIRIPLEGTGRFYEKETMNYGMVLCIGITGLLGVIAGFAALEEKVLVHASFLYNFTGWLFMMAIQYYRVAYNNDLLDGLLFSILKWTALFIIIHIIFTFFFIRVDKKRIEREEENKRKGSIEKVGNNYVYTFGDGSKITVTQEDFQKKVE
ncbi:hypothetical protein MKZ12_09435 [Paenibacillus sp. FSL R5-0713]|uniref:hypothetical protein n=1 Tax=Paenibacillus sp. FSL R5-0713 TaxID=2921655 RepID=UPI0030DCAF91